MQVNPLYELETQAYDDNDMQRIDGFDRNISNKEMATLEYDLQPAANEPAQSKPDSQAMDEMQTQVVTEAEVFSGDNRRNRGSAELASQSSSVAPTQVFDLSDHIRPQSQTEVAATQTFDAANSRRPNSQTDFLATQVFDPVSAAHGDTNGLNSRTGNSQAEPATQVLDALPTVQRKSGGSPGLNSYQSNSQSDLQTQVFCEPVAIAAPRRTSGTSPQLSTQTFSSPNPPRKTSSIGRDGSRMSFSPDSCSTQVFPSEVDFPHLTLEMSECNDSSHNDSCTVPSAAVHVSLQQVSLCDWLL